MILNIRILGRAEGRGACFRIAEGPTCGTEHAWGLLVSGSWDPALWGICCATWKSAVWFPAAAIEGHGNDLSSSQVSLPTSCDLGYCVLSKLCGYVVPQQDWKTASVPSQIRLHSIWICRINITIIIGKKMENDSVQKWVLECTSGEWWPWGKKNLHHRLYGISPQCRLTWGGRTEQWRLREQRSMHWFFVHSVFTSWVPTMCHSVWPCGYNSKQSGDYPYLCAAHDLYWYIIFSK